LNHFADVVQFLSPASQIIGFVRVPIELDSSPTGSVNVRFGS
jgi:hypothetical protein